VVRDAVSLRRKVEETVEHFEYALVERFLGDDPALREFTVALIGSGPSTLVMPAEILLSVPKRTRVITTADKDGHRTEARQVEESSLREGVARLAKKAFAAAGVRDYSRCDILLAGGELYAIEINGQPMVPDPWFEACAEGAGLDGDAYLGAIFLAAILRIDRETGADAGGAPIGIPDAMRDLIPPAAFAALTGKGG
jgi:D-alanine-D-alanine ligase-like ATP-grasp enzyme